MGKLLLLLLALWMALLSAMMFFFAFRPLAPLDMQHRLFGIDPRRLIADEEKYRRRSRVMYAAGRIVLALFALGFMISAFMMWQPPSGHHSPRRPGAALPLPPSAHGLG